VDEAWSALNNGADCCCAVTLESMQETNNDKTILAGEMNMGCIKR
jgi:hypothetical protein